MLFRFCKSNKQSEVLSSAKGVTVSCLQCPVHWHSQFQCAVRGWAEGEGGGGAQRYNITPYTCSYNIVDAWTWQDAGRIRTLPLPYHNRQCRFTLEVVWKEHVHNFSTKRKCNHYVRGRRWQSSYGQRVLGVKLRIEFSNYCGILKQKYSDQTILKQRYARARTFTIHLTP